MWRLVTLKRLAEGQPTEDINHLMSLMTKLNKDEKDKTILYDIEKAE